MFYIPLVIITASWYESRYILILLECMNKTVQIRVFMGRSRSNSVKGSVLRADPNVALYQE